MEINTREVIQQVIPPKIILSIGTVPLTVNNPDIIVTIIRVIVDRKL